MELIKYSEEQVSALLNKEDCGVKLESLYVKHGFSYDELRSGYEFILTEYDKGVVSKELTFDEFVTFHVEVLTGLYNITNELDSKLIEILQPEQIEMLNDPNGGMHKLLYLSKVDTSNLTNLVVLGTNIEYARQLSDEDKQVIMDTYPEQIAVELIAISLHLISLTMISDLIDILPFDKLIEEI